MYAISLQVARGSGTMKETDLCIVAEEGKALIGLYCDIPDPMTWLRLPVGPKLACLQKAWKSPLSVRGRATMLQECAIWLDQT